MATARRLPLVRLPGGLMPRMALGYLVLPAARILARVGLPVASAGDLAEAVELLKTMAGGLGPERPVAANEAKRLSEGLDARTPPNYCGHTTARVAGRWNSDHEE